MASVKNIEEGRFIMHPEGYFFTREIESERKQENSGPVQCWCE